MPFPRQDLAAMYRTLGDPVSHIAQGSGAVTAGLFGIYVEPGQSVIGGDMIVDQPVMRYPLALWPQINRGDQLTITLPGGSVTRVVREIPTRLGEGSEALVKLGGAA